MRAPPSAVTTIKPEVRPETMSSLRRSDSSARACCACSLVRIRVTASAIAAATNALSDDSRAADCPIRFAALRNRKTASTTMPSRANRNALTTIRV